jgi:hypothetical protein
LQVILSHRTLVLIKSLLGCLINFQTLHSVTGISRMHGFWLVFLWNSFHGLTSNNPPLAHVLWMLLVVRLITLLLWSHPFLLLILLPLLCAVSLTTANTHAALQLLGIKPGSQRSLSLSWLTLTLTLPFVNLMPRVYPVMVSLHGPVCFLFDFHVLSYSPLQPPLVLLSTTSLSLVTSPLLVLIPHLGVVPNLLGGIWCPHQCSMRL